MEFKDGRGQQVIRMFSEPPNTSTFLQAADQIGKQFVHEDEVSSQSPPLFPCANNHVSAHGVVERHGRNW
jgi:hypothetical protein